MQTAGATLLAVDRCSLRERGRLPRAATVRMGCCISLLYEGGMREQEQASRPVCHLMLSGRLGEAADVRQIRFAHFVLMQLFPVGAPGWQAPVAPRPLAPPPDPAGGLPR